MKRINTSLILMISLLVTGQLYSQHNNDTIGEKIDEIRDHIHGLDERLLTAESDLSKLNKIKFSGYIQGQYENYSNKLTYPDNQFFLRRVRLKTTYQAAEGVTFVLQPDFLPSGISLKDAYVQLNDRWTKEFSLTLGQFNRLNYEVEYSSSQREVPERSLMIRTLYPGERAIGAKIEYTPIALPLKIQLALFNGNEGGITYPGTNVNPSNKDFDNYKDIMARATYSIKLGSIGGLDLGAHTYIGKVKAVVDTVVNSAYQVEKVVNIGDALSRNWIGAEFQLFLDILGGASLKGEFITGNNVIPGYSTLVKGTPVVTTSLSNDTLTWLTTTTNTTTYQANYRNKFSGYYLYFIKNIGSKNQFALRYDYFDPNTDLTGNEIGTMKHDQSISTSTSSSYTFVNQSNVIVYKNKVNNIVTNKISSGKGDLAWQTLTLAWHYYFNDNIRITAAYAMPMNEKTINIAADKATIDGVEKVNEYDKVWSNNTFTLRIQAKF